MWIWKNKKWPNFQWDSEALSKSLSETRLAQGKLLGIIKLMNSEVRDTLDLGALTEEAIDTSAIEGEHLNRASVRSSVENRLGLKQAGVQAVKDRYVDGLLDMLLDASEHYQQPLTLERLCAWHAALFPTGYSGIRKITVGSLREFDPMQIISGRPGKETVHYEAPSSVNLKSELAAFLLWFNQKSNDIDGLIRAGLAHLWFELVHPFEDGNGRVGRAIIDLALAQDEGLSTRYYSLSSAILKDRKNYYANLQIASQGELDVTAWLSWFLQCFASAIEASIALIHKINLKSQFWAIHQTDVLNERQIKALNRMLSAGKDGFEGGMTTKKYMHLTKVSRATAYRELSDLVEKKCLFAIDKKGRSSAYEINWPDV